MCMYVEIFCTIVSNLLYSTICIQYTHWLKSRLSMRCSFSHSTQNRFMCVSHLSSQIFWWCKWCEFHVSKNKNVFETFIYLLYFDMRYVTNRETIHTHTHTTTANSVQVHVWCEGFELLAHLSLLTVAVWHTHKTALYISVREFVRIQNQCAPIYSYRIAYYHFTPCLGLVPKNNDIIIVFIKSSH